VNSLFISRRQGEENPAAGLLLKQMFLAEGRFLILGKNFSRKIV
jgi:hypothetical protein